MNSCIKNPIGVLLITLSFSSNILAQGKDSAWVGSISGSVKDTTLKYFMQAASVSIYKASDGSLVAYSMTNTLGEFHLTALPTGLLLRLNISYIGYKARSQTLILSKSEPNLTIGAIVLAKDTGKLEDSVVVTPPPVRINGDTLEFSAAAFSLDKNAVAEDLLKKLPGVVVWGDGTITVNGKQISKLLVDGKPFFGGETKVATQNIPKNAIDKIQVYQEQVNPFDPLDSTTTVNIKLRKNRSSGYFGAFDAGGGTDQRYELGANSSLFSPRSEYAIVAQNNNINKIANDIGTLLRSNTYKGVGVRVEYQPDYTLQGRNQPTSGGILFSHDFIPAFDNYQKDRLSSNAFINHNTNETIRNTQTVSYIGNDSALTQNTSSDAKSTTEANNFSAHYLKHRDENTLNIEGAYSGGRINAQDAVMNVVRGPGGSPESGDSEYDSSMHSTGTFSLKSSFDHIGSAPVNGHQLTNWNISHIISYQTGKKDSVLQSNFASEADPLLNRAYNRKYNDDTHAVNQTLSMQLGDLSRWLFADQREFTDFHLEVKNDLKLDVASRNDLVKDIDSSTHSFMTNDYLTANGRYTVWSENPDVRLGKNFSYVLANRYQKELSIFMDAKTQLFSEQNVSSRKFQEFDNTYSHFVPAFDLEYSNFQYGEFLDKYDLNVDISYDYPTVDQRVPLVDSSNIYYIREGNPLLGPMKKYELSAKFRHDSYSSKNAFAYGANLQGGATARYFSDSAIVDVSGRYTYYPVNLNGYRYLTGGVFLNKAFLFDAHQLQVKFSSVAQLSRTPGYLKYQTAGTANPIVSDMFVNSDSLSFYYTFKDFLAINLNEYVSLFRSSEEGLDNSKFSSTQSATRLGLALNLTKKLSFNSNVTYNSSTTSGAGVSVYRYTIWNASIAYRFLPGNNLELKASALDLLNQNKGVINYASNLSYTHGTVNLLHQYFMMTITYFPRKFGNPKTTRANPNSQ